MEEGDASSIYAAQPASPVAHGVSDVDPDGVLSEPLTNIAAHGEKRPCTSEAGDLLALRAAQPAELTSFPPDALDCSAIELELPSLSLCHATDQLSLEWRFPVGGDSWQTLESLVSPLQPRVHIDGLDPSSVYTFRLSLRLDGAAEAMVGPPSPPVLVDGSSLLHLMSAASLQPAATSSSSIEVPWLKSACRSQLEVRVTLQRQDSGSESRQNDVTTLPREEVEVTEGSLVLQRARCPKGCRLSIHPVGLQGWELAPKTTSVVSTPRLPELADEGCRMEVKLLPPDDVVASSDLQKADSDETLASQLASDLAAVLAISTEQASPWR
ncbi:MAG: hypothetical protein SGPRY_009989, partial [Prymnesium sp.]